jgi:hypothetical protein
MLAKASKGLANIKAVILGFFLSGKRYVWLRIFEDKIQLSENPDEVSRIDGMQEIPLKI